MSSTYCEVVAKWPYPGLRPFERHEADIFFGRKRHVTDLLKRLKSQRFLAVVGPSGCGKSSLIRAGLIPALEAGFMARSQCQWNFAVLRPGNQPLLHLAEALLQSGVFGESDGDQLSTAEQMKEDLEASSRSLANRLLVNERAQGANLFILVDQFEELFRFEQQGGGDESRAFVNLLLETARDPDISAYVVITMRTDFLGQCPVFAGLPEALNESQYLTPRLTREQTEAAILGPARMFDGDVEPDIVARILNKMGTDPDQLPLMQHVLMRMWRSAMQRAGLKTEASEQTVLFGEDCAIKRPHILLTREDYEEAGGLRKALGQHAQGVFDSRLSSQQQTLAERMFRRLTDVAPNGQLIRRSPPPKFGELCEMLGTGYTEELREVINVFRREGRSFLMPPPNEPLEPDTPIDISHESLIRNWQLLERWTREEGHATLTRDEITKDAKAWDSGGRRPSDAAIAESQLAAAMEWAKRRPYDVTPLVHDFLDACKQQKQKSQAAHLRSRVTTVVAGLVAGLALVFAVVAAIVYGEHQKAARALADRFWQEAVQEFDNRSQGQDVVAALLWTAEAYNHEPKRWKSRKDLEELYQVRTDAILAQYPRLQDIWHRPGIMVKAASPDHRFVVTAQTKGWSDLQIWDSSDHAKKPQTLGLQNPIQVVKFSRDGKYLLAVLGRDDGGEEDEPEGDLVVWRWSSAPEQTLQRFNLPLPVSSRVLTADFVSIASSSGRSAPQVVAIVQEQSEGRKYTALKLWRSFKEPPEEFDATEKYVRRGTAEENRLAGPSPTGLAASPDGKYVATWGTLDKTESPAICIWDVERRALVSYDATVAGIATAEFSKTGKWLMMVDRNGQAHLRSPSRDQKWTTWDAHIGAGQKVVFSPLEQFVVTVGVDNVVRLWEIRSSANSQDADKQVAGVLPTLKVALPHDSDIYDAAFSPDGSLIATAGRDRIARVWSSDTGQLVFPPLYHASALARVEFIDNSTLRTSTLFANSHVWVLKANNPLPTALNIGPETRPMDANKLFHAYSDNGHFVVTASNKDESVQIQLWDVSETPPRRCGQPMVHDGARSISYAAVSDDGHRVLTVVETDQEGPLQSGYLWNIDDSTKHELWDKQPPSRCCAAFSPNAKLLLLAKEPSVSDSAAVPWALHVWSEERKQLFSFEGKQAGPVNHIAWNSDGGTSDADRPYAVVSSGKTDRNEKGGAAELWRWSLQQGQFESVHLWKHEPLPGQLTSNAVLFAAFSSDGRHVATGGMDDTVYLWDVLSDSDEPLARNLRHTSDVVHVVFSPNGKLLATSSLADKKTQVWDVDALQSWRQREKPEPMFTLNHGGAVNRATFSADGKWLATASSDKTARVWSLACHGQMAAQFRHPGNVKALCFSENGQQLITVSDSVFNTSNSLARAEAWPKCWKWTLKRSQPGQAPVVTKLKDYIKLIAASQLNESRTGLQALSLETPLESDTKYYELWQEYGSVLFAAPTAAPQATVVATAK